MPNTEMIHYGPCVAGGYHGSWETCEQCAPAPVLSARGREHLVFLRDVENGRRQIDPMGDVWKARDVIHCAATNLEHEQPQPYGRRSIAELEGVADLLVELDAARVDLATLRRVLRLVRAPQLVRLADRIAIAAAGGDTTALASAVRMLEHIADDLAHLAADPAARPPAPSTTRRPDDGTEDYDERCRLTESCDCPDCATTDDGDHP